MVFVRILTDFPRRNEIIVSVLGWRGGVVGALEGEEFIIIDKWAVLLVGVGHT